MSRTPFYRTGTLRFECSGCGVCCQGDPDAQVFLTDSEAECIRELLNLSARWFRIRYLKKAADGGLALRLKPNGDCSFLSDAGGCTIYAARPAQCRTYPFWPEIVMTRAGWRRERARCEGVGHGRLYTEVEIEAILRSLDVA